MRIKHYLIMEYRHIMEAYFKMIYVRQYHELVNSPDGVDITIHKRNNALKAEQELKDLGIEYKNNKFSGMINNVDAEVLFQNMNAKPAIERGVVDYFNNNNASSIKEVISDLNKKTIIVESKDDIKQVIDDSNNNNSNENIEKE